MTFANQKLSIFLASVSRWFAAAAPTHAQVPARIAATKEHIRVLHAKSAQVEVTVTPGKTLRGKIMQVANETFVVRQKAGAEETVEYAQVIRIKKQGVRKSLLVPAAIGGAAVVILCVAPYPIGFLCRRDPS